MYLFKCNYLDKLKDKTIQKFMVSESKNINVKKGPSSVQKTKELRSKRVPSSIAVA